MHLSALLLTITSFLQPVPNAVATFDGTFKVSNGKFIEVQMDFPLPLLTGPSR